MPFLPKLTVEEQTNILARYLPNDRIYIGKYIEDNPMRKILIGLAAVWLDYREILDLLFDEWDPQNTSIFLDEWEKSVGIPDDCFDIAATDDERRVNILLKLTSLNATTAKQFEAVAAILGITVTVTSGLAFSTLPLILPFLLLSAEEAAYTIVVTLDASLEPEGFPLTLPFTLTSPFPDILECLFNKLKPVNTQIIFRYE